MFDPIGELSRRDLLRAGAAALATPALVGLSGSPARANDPYADAVLVEGQPPAPQPGAFSIAVLPDTQNYSEKFPEIYAAQTKWIVEHREARKIACVLHLGDITNHNTPEQWENAVRAMRTLDGKVPYCLTPGNHDYSEGGRCTDRTTLINDYFPVSAFKKQSTFGGTYDREPDRIENSYHRFTAADRKFLVIALEFGPRRDVVRWANEVVAKHRDHAAILITHAYMYFDDTRYDWGKYGAQQNWNPHSYGVARTTADDVMDGEELWTNLVSKHDNFIMTLNGHVLGDGLGKLTSPAPDQGEVHQMLVNFQMRPQGGDGWLRLLEFQPNGKTVQVYDYSPTRDQHNQSPQNQFALSLT